MILKSTHRVTAIIMAFMLFITSTGFSIDVHSCNGHVKSMSLFGKAKSCHAEQNSCPNHAKQQLVEVETSDCCSNETIQVENLDEDYNFIILDELTDLQLVFVASFLYSLFPPAPSRVVKSSFLETHKPLQPRDIYVLLERFLI